MRTQDFLDAGFELIEGSVESKFVVFYRPIGPEVSSSPLRDELRRVLTVGLIAGTVAATSGAHPALIWDDTPEIKAVLEWDLFENISTTIRQHADLDEIQHIISPEFLRAIQIVESGFDPTGVSGKGARGLMQLMPITVQEISNQLQEIGPEPSLEAFQSKSAVLRALFGHGRGPLVFQGVVRSRKDSVKAAAYLLYDNLDFLRHHEIVKTKKRFLLKESLQPIARDRDWERKTILAMYNAGRGPVVKKIRRHGDKWPSVPNGLPVETREFIRKVEGLLPVPASSSPVSRLPQALAGERDGHGRTISPLSPEEIAGLGLLTEPIHKKGFIRTLAAIREVFGPSHEGREALVIGAAGDPYQALGFLGFNVTAIDKIPDSGLVLSGQEKELLRKSGGRHKFMAMDARHLPDVFGTDHFDLVVVSNFFDDPRILHKDKIASNILSVLKNNAKILLGPVSPAVLGFFVTDESGLETIQDGLTASLLTIGSHEPVVDRRDLVLYEVRKTHDRKVSSSPLMKARGIVLRRMAAGWENVRNEFNILFKGLGASGARPRDAYLHMASAAVILYGAVVFISGPPSHVLGWAGLVPAVMVFVFAANLAAAFLEGMILDTVQKRNGSANKPHNDQPFSFKEYFRFLGGTLTYAARKSRRFEYHRGFKRMSAERRILYVREAVAQLHVQNMVGLLVRDPSEVVRMEAAQWFGEKGEKGHVREILDLVVTDALRYAADYDPDGAVRQKAREALYKIEHGAAERAARDSSSISPVQKRGSSARNRDSGSSPLDFSRAGQISVEAWIDHAAAVDGDSWVGAGTEIGPGARIINSVLAEDIKTEDEIVIENSVILRGVHIGRGSVIADALLEEDAVIAPFSRVAGAFVGAGYQWRDNGVPPARDLEKLTEGIIKGNAAFEWEALDEETKRAAVSLLGFLYGEIRPLEFTGCATYNWLREAYRRIDRQTGYVRGANDVIETRIKEIFKKIYDNSNHHRHVMYDGEEELSYRQAVGLVDFENLLRPVLRQRPRRRNGEGKSSSPIYSGDRVQGTGFRAKIAGVNGDWQEPWTFAWARWFERYFYELWEKMLKLRKKVKDLIVFNVPEDLRKTGYRVQGAGFRGDGRWSMVHGQAFKVSPPVGAVVHAAMETNGSPLEPDWYRFYTNKLDPLTPNHEIYMKKFVTHFMDPDKSDWQEFRRMVEADSTSPWQAVLVKVRDMEGGGPVAVQAQSVTGGIQFSASAYFAD